MAENLNNVVEAEDAQEFKGKIAPKKVENEDKLTNILNEYFTALADTMKPKKEENKNKYNSE